MRRVLLLLATVVLLSLAFAPISQFYLAWIGLAPLLLLIRDAKSNRRAFFWGWIAGTVFFSANMWWLWFISGAGTIALMMYCGLYWAVAALLIRAGGILRGSPLFGVFAAAAVWTALEWLRGTVLTGIPMLFLGHSQSPALILCQIADITSVYGLTFWLVALNALAVFGWVHRDKFRPVVPAAIAVGALTFAMLGYGYFRIAQTPGCLSPGPTIAVVQSMFPMDNSGQTAVRAPQRLQQLEDETNALLAAHPGKIDLVVWSETVMPPMNREARLVNPDWGDYVLALRELTQTNHIALLTGGEFAASFVDQPRDGKVYSIPTDQRNSAYFFDSQGRMDDSLGHRYDKIHLVPFGEFIPFKDSIPWIYHILVGLGPKYYEDYVLQSGAPDALTVFRLSDQNHDWRLVTPICYEDFDARICAAMFRPAQDRQKRADVLVNLTNDGWYRANENALHLQAAVFRSIENRAPTARAVNMGISGFVDSIGRTSSLVPVRISGGSVTQVMIDRRLTFYTRFGDCFAAGCVVFAAGLAVVLGFHRQKSREDSAAKTKKRETP